jgi:hypothetical protein
MNDCLVVRFSYFKGQETVVERYRHLNEKLRYHNIEPRVPWLERLKLEFVFEDIRGNKVSY